MKKSKFLIGFLGLITALTSCSGNSEHEHTFKEWSSNEISHWHEVDCEHAGITLDLQEHTYGDDNLCTVCGYRKHNFSLVGNLLSLSPSDVITSFLPEAFSDSAPFINLIVDGFIAESFGEGELVLLRQSFEYESIGYDNKPITLSGALTIPCFNGKIDVRVIDFDSHPTFTDKLEAVSYGPDIYSILSIIGALTIEFDLIGFGSSYYLPADYHCRHLMVKNSIDGILAANYLLKENFDISIAEYPQILTGYSQGGYDSLALLRYLETEATENIKEIIKPNFTCSGSGAYDIKLLIDESLKKPDFMYPEYILMGIITAKYYHPEIFKDHSIEEFLTDYGKRFIDPIIRKDDATLQALKLEEDDSGELLYKTPSDFFSNDFLCGDQGLELKQIVEDYCKEENLLDGKWKPQGQLYLFYTEDDEIVTPECSKKAAELFKDLLNVEMLEGSGDHRSAAVEYYLDLVGLVNDLFDEE